MSEGLAIDADRRVTKTGDCFLSAHSYLQHIFPLRVLLAAQPPLFEEAAQLEAEQ